MSQLSERLENDAPRIPDYLPANHRQGTEQAWKAPGSRKSLPRVPANAPRMSSTSGKQV